MMSACPKPPCHIPRTTWPSPPASPRFFGSSCEVAAFGMATGIWELLALQGSWAEVHFQLFGSIQKYQQRRQRRRGSPSPQPEESAGRETPSLAGSSQRRASPTSASSSTDEALQLQIGSSKPEEIQALQRRRPGVRKFPRSTSTTSRSAYPTCT